MSVLSWLVFPILVLGALAVAALWLRRRAHAPLAILAVVAGFSLLAHAAERPAIAVIQGVGIRNGLPWAVIGGLAIIAGCVQTFRYLSFRAGPSMRLNRTSGNTVMTGLGFGAMRILRGAITGSDSRADEQPVTR